MKSRHALAYGLFVLLLLSFQIAEGQDVPAPFLYYYSDTLRTFMIERADGTDTRILSQVEMPENTTDVRVVGWSPSGEWLAWTSESTFVGGYTSKTAWAANIDGVRSLDMLADAGIAYRMIWSPIEDVLFVAGREREPTTAFSHQTVLPHHFFLIDAQTQSTLVQFDLETSFADLGQVVWTRDGQQLVFEYTLRTDDTPSAFIRRISPDGTIEDIAISRPIETLIRFSEAYPRDYWVLTEGHESHQIIAVNAFSGHWISFDVPAPINSVYALQWNRQQDHALLYVRTPRSNDHFELWLLSVTDQTLQSLSMDAENYANENSTWSAWLPNSSYAAFYTDDGLYGVKFEPHLQVFQIFSTSYVARNWVAGETQLYFTAQVADEAGNTRAGYFVYDFIEDSLTERDTFDLPRRFINASQQFTVLENPLTVLDHTTNSTYPLSPDSRAEEFGYSHALQSVTWYKDRPWLITADSFPMMDGGHYLFISVNDAYGTVHRELGSCFIHCAGWLPASVLTHVESQ